jgi:hypothetical protein
MKSARIGSLEQFEALIGDGCWRGGTEAVEKRLKSG